MKFTVEQKTILDADHKLTIEQLKAKYGGEDGEHPVITRALFETDKRLLFGDPKYWPYVETCFQINYSKYERPARVQPIRCYGESEVGGRMSDEEMTYWLSHSHPELTDEQIQNATLGLTTPEALGIKAPSDRLKDEDKE